MHFAFSFAAQAAEVQVNTRTGEVEVLRVISANDVGYAINPLGLRGQIEGGVMMGLGHTLTENFHRGRGPRDHRPAGALSHAFHHPHPGNHSHRGRAPGGQRPLWRQRRG